MSYKNVIYLSHNGLGDNIFSISALRFLLIFYETVSFLHRDIYHENIKLFFNDEPRIICTPFNTNSEFDHCKEIINNNPDKDLIICGSHKNYLKTRITNEKFLNYINSHRKDNQKYDLYLEKVHYHKRCTFTQCIIRRFNEYKISCHRRWIAYIISP